MIVPSPAVPETLPPLFADWFARRGWSPRRHQLEMIQAAQDGVHALLVAPTGGGKTLAGFLPSLIDLAERGPRPAFGPGSGVHTLYLSPLKALTTDVERNLMAPIREIGLNIHVESRTGDTKPSKRQRQRDVPPDILLTTPEQLALFCAWDGARAWFADLKCVVLDEIHAIWSGKRGDLLNLGLGRLQSFAPQVRRVALSATIDDPQMIADWLAPSPLAGEGGPRRGSDGGAGGDNLSLDDEVRGEHTPHPTGSAAHLPPREGKGRLIASDVVQKRLDNIRPRLARAGVEAELRLLGQNGGGMEDLNGQADLVFVDAPCSGSGTWRRRPEEAWRLTEAEVERLHALQVRILGQAAKLVRPSGRLLYVTCSMLSRENEASADAFETAHPEFLPVALSAPPPAEGGSHRLRLSPASTNTDGFFAALYERTA